MLETEQSVTVQKDGYTEEQKFFTHSAGEEEGNYINAQNAKVLDDPKFVMIDFPIMRRYDLDIPLTALYGYLDFFSFGGKNTIYVTNEQLANLFKYSESTIKRMIKVLVDKGLVRSTYKTFSSGTKITTIRKMTIVGQIEPTVVGQIEPQLNNLVNNILLHNIEESSNESSSEDVLDSLTLSNNELLSKSKQSLKEKTYGNSEVNLLKKVLLKRYPLALEGITDRRKLFTLYKVLTKSKDYDFLNEDWKENFAEFFSEYIEKTDEPYLARGIDKLREKVKVWREVKKSNLLKEINNE